MPDTSLMVVGALVLMGGVLILPYGDAYVKLFLIVVGTLVLAGGVVQALRRRRDPADRDGGGGPSRPKGRRTGS